MPRTPLCFALLLAACATRAEHGAHVIATASRGDQTVGWTESEKAARVAIRNLRASPEASFHLLRVRERLPLRVHHKSDLVLMIVSGQAEVRFADQRTKVSSGDVVEIPQGTAYGLERRGEAEVVAYLVYTPALAADDTAQVDEPQHESVWKWNLWLQ